MKLVVQKFGGSSVPNVKKLNNVAKIITKCRSEGNNVVVVVSAQGNTTDNLIAEALKVNENPPKREMDVLLSSGEQVSMTLLAMAVEKLGYSVISLTGWQAGFRTNSDYGNAKIQHLDAKRILEELNKGNIVIVAGFQGINDLGNITTFGRGGSDTSAIKIAAELNASECKIFTDVAGVCTADPQIVKNSKKIDKLNFNEMLAFALSGAKVMNERAVQIAKKHNVKFEILSSYTNLPGTIIEKFDYQDKIYFCGVSADHDIIKISIEKLPSDLNFKNVLFKKLSEKNINFVLSQPQKFIENSEKFSLIIKKMFLAETTKIIDSLLNNESLKNIKIIDTMGILSLIGSNLNKNDNILNKILEILTKNNIENLQILELNNNNISLLLEKNFLEFGIIKLHKEFFEKS